MMNENKAYQAMLVFLKKYYKSTNAEDIGALIGSMQLLEDGQPADPGMWTEWLESVQEVIGEKVFK